MKNLEQKFLIFKNLNVIFLILLGFSIGILHLPLVLELSLGYTLFSSSTQTFLFLLYPFSVTMMGVGALLLKNYPARYKFIFIALSLFGLITCNVLLPFNLPAFLTIPLHLLIQSFFLVVFYIFTGGFYASFITATKEENVFLEAWVLHLLSLGIGYWVSDYIVETVGPSAFIISCACTFMLLPLMKKKSLFFLLALLFCSFYFRVDYLIESNRNISHLKETRSVNVVSSVMAKTHELKRKHLTLINLGDDNLNFNKLEFLKWSRRGQLRVLKNNGTKCWFYYNMELNLKNTFDKSGIEAFRQYSYNYFPKGSRIAIIGFGAGRSLEYIPSDKLSKNIFGIERNKSTVIFTKDIRPDLSDFKINKITSINSDGRYFIERSHEKFDLIFLESSHDQSKPTSIGLYSPYSLWTSEAFNLYLNKINEQGLFIYELASGDLRGGLRAPVEAIFKKMNFPFFTLIHSRRFYLVAARNNQALEKYRAGIPETILNDIKKENYTDTENAPLCNQDLNDNYPFISWNCSLDSKSKIISASYIVIFVSTIILFLIIYFKAISIKRSTYFYILGIAHSLFLMHAFFSWRTFFGDELITFLRIISYFIFCTIFSVILISKYKISQLPKLPLTLFLFLLLALHFLFLNFIPFESSSSLMRESFAILAVIPGGIFVGLMYPMAFNYIDEKEISYQILADSLGTFVSYALLNLLIPYGIMSIGLVTAILYSLIILMFIRFFRFAKK
jgi:spermidine synthase